MRKTRVSLPERKGVGLKQNQQSTQRKQTPTIPRALRKNISVNMENIGSNKEQTTGEKLIDQKTVIVAENDLEMPEQSIDGMERKTTESTPMQNVEEPVTKTIEFSPIGNGD